MPFDPAKLQAVKSKGKFDPTKLAAVKKGISISGIAGEAVKSAITPLIPSPIPGMPETKISDIARNPSAQQFAIGAVNQAGQGLVVPGLQKGGVPNSPYCRRRYWICSRYASKGGSGDCFKNTCSCG
jgi:hypothetical protein